MIKDNYLYTIDPAKGREIMVGKIIDEGVLIIDKKDSHFMRVVGGYGIQETAFNEAEKYGIHTIIIHNTDSKKDYYCTLENWKEHGKTADYGHGKQVFLSLKYMNENGKS